MRHVFGGIAATISVMSTVFAAETLSLDGKWKLDFFPQPDAGAVRTLPLPEGLDVKHVTATVPVSPLGSLPGKAVQ